MRCVRSLPLFFFIQLHLRDTVLTVIPLFCIDRFQFKKTARRLEVVNVAPMTRPALLPNVAISSWDPR